jgi:hypothetical protein
MRFINANNFKGEEQLYQARVNMFMDLFNRKLIANSRYLNTRVDNFGNLSDKEFKMAEKQAYKDGWVLTQFIDVHESISYKLTNKNK